MAGRQRRRDFRWLVLLLALAPARAPAAMSGGPGTGNYALAPDERNLKLTAVPIPGYSDVLGPSLGLVGMAFYKLDRDDDACPPSVTGAFGFYSENNTWLGAAFQRFHLPGDRWRATAAFGGGSVRYQFAPAAVTPGLPDVMLDYTTALRFGVVMGERRVWNRLYAGLAALSWTAGVTLGVDGLEAEEENYAGPGLVAEWDGADHVINAWEGWRLKGRWLQYDDAFGSDRDFAKAALTLTGYRSIPDSTAVLAGRLLGDFGIGDVPFSAQSIVNGNRNLRGYSNGRYRGDTLVSAELEFRRGLGGRWGAVAFAGVAFAATDVAAFALDDALPGGGLGLRYLLIEAFRVNARVDYGWGRGDHALYIAIGEAY